MKHGGFQRERRCNSHGFLMGSVTPGQHPTACRGPRPEVGSNARTGQLPHQPSMGVTALTHGPTTEKGKKPGGQVESRARSRSKWMQRRPGLQPALTGARPGLRASLGTVLVPPQLHRTSGAWGRDGGGRGRRCVRVWAATLLAPGPGPGRPGGARGSLTGRSEVRQEDVGSGETNWLSMGQREAASAEGSTGVSE